jgi:methylated-DNA-[protein]-cysteine S-methyltransferase
MKTSVYFDCIVSPLGPMVLASDGEALTGAWFDGQRHQPPIGPDWRRRADLPVLRRAAAELAEYFAGERTAFDLPLAPAGTPFQRSVWMAIAQVRYGETIAYRELAARVGRPLGLRAAGAATGRNPLSIVIPCHRIVGADGRLTGYAGGLMRKRSLLGLERRLVADAAAPRASGELAAASARAVMPGTAPVV